LRRAQEILPSYEKLYCSKAKGGREKGGLDRKYLSPEGRESVGLEDEDKQLECGGLGYQFKKDGNGGISTVQRMGGREMGVENSAGESRRSDGGWHRPSRYSPYYNEKTEHLLTRNKGQEPLQGNEMSLEENLMSVQQRLCLAGLKTDRNWSPNRKY